MPGSQVCSTCAKWKIGCTWLKWKSQLFIELDVEGDWVHWIKQLWVDKGKGQMEMADEGQDEEEAWAWYWADIHRLAESNEAISHSFEALVALLADQLPVSVMENLETGGSEGEEEEELEDAEEGYV